MKMEVLAPVGSNETLTAAVWAGADAVYFGGKSFNARRNADNFDLDGLKQAIEYCKLHAVKSYLTLNILIKDSEMEQAVKLAREAYEVGIDGIIIQDLGLAAVLHRRLPQLALHASTQLSIYSPAALLPLKELGFKRVVAAREMSKEQLAEFCRAAAELKIEVEVFVHGALCMSLSGQCYFSAFLGGRSANRGLCAGTCRLPFAAEGGTGYDLSLKDLSLLDQVEALARIGVTSLKIEGRMKRPEYVASAVHCFKQATQTYKVDPESRALLENVFSRGGFTDGYFTQKLGQGMFGVRTEQEKQLSGEVLGKIHALYRRPLQKLPLSFRICIEKGKPVTLYAAYRDYAVSLTGELPAPALHRPLDEQRIRECLSKLGGSPYFASEIICRLDPDLSLPISSLNALRKQAVEQLDRQRTLIKVPPIGEDTTMWQKPAAPRQVQGFFARFQNRGQLSLFPKDPPLLLGYSLPAEVLIDWPDGLPALKGTDPLLSPAAELPRFGADEWTAKLLDRLQSLGIKTVVCGSLAALSLAKQRGFHILGGFGLNIYNSHSIETLGGLGVFQTVLSPELSFLEIKALRAADPNLRLFSMCYGRQPLMLMKNCPVKNGIGCSGRQAHCELTDRKETHFPVLCRNGFCEILNAKTTYIADRLETLCADIGYLYYTTETAEAAKNVYDRYCSRAKPNSDFTRGLFRSGVK